MSIEDKIYYAFIRKICDSIYWDVQGTSRDTIYSTTAGATHMATYSTTARAVDRATKEITDSIYTTRLSRINSFLESVEIYIIYIFSAILLISVLTFIYHLGARGIR